MSEKRYFKVEYFEEWYLFDSNTISEELVTEQAEYGYGVFANSLSPSEICERLNEQQSIIDEQKIAIDEMIIDYKNLEKENKQLQKEKEYYREYALKYLLEYDLYTDNFLNDIKDIIGEEGVKRIKEKQNEIIEALKKEGLYE